MLVSNILGERKIIEIIWSILEKKDSMPVPFGDDVSACNLGRKKLAILKTDMLVDKTDVPPGMNLWQAARKAVVINVSDFAAKGVNPLAMLISLGIPKKYSKKKRIEEIAKGLNAGSKEFGIKCIGGDTNETTDLVINPCLFGIAKRSALMLRSGANPGDLVAVTGFFGKTAAGLKILLEGIKVPKKIRNVLVETVLMPSARLKEGVVLSQTKAVTAAIDSSDGLALSLHEISNASKVGFLITELPTSKEVKIFAKVNKFDPFEFTFYGGEEYELILTITPEHWNKAEEAIRSVGGSLFLIGKVIKEKKVLFSEKKSYTVIEQRGWEHFK